MPKLHLGMHIIRAQPRLLWSYGSGIQRSEN